MSLRLFLFILITSIGFPFYSQLNFEAHLPLKSYGEIPVSLRNDCKFMLFDNTQTPYLSIGKTNEEEIHSFYKSLVSTGKVLFGDITHASCTEIVKRLVAADPEIQQPVEIYAFKSSYPCAVNDGRSTIYVSTALIALTPKPEQLYFLIATQLYHLKNKSQPEFFKLNRVSDYIERLKTVHSYSSEITSKADLYALNSITRLQMNPSNAIEGLSILAAEDPVVEEVSIPSNYFSSPLLQFPQALFDNSAYRFEKMIPSNKQIALSNRKQELQKSELMQKSADSLTELKKDFKLLQTVCTYQYIEDLILENDPEKALYHILVMESKSLSSDYLNKMKLHAWLAFIRKSAYPTLGKIAPKRIIRNTQSGQFYIALRRLNLHATETVALRIATDLTLESKDPEFTMLRNYLIDLIQQIGSFPISTFYTTTFQVASQNTSEPTSTFYLYGISDLVKDSTFVNQISGKGSIYEKEKKYNSVLVIDPLAYSFHKQHLKAEKTLKKTSILEKTIESQASEANLNLHFFKVDTNSMTNRVDMYNLRSCYNRLHLQLSNHTQYKMDVFPLNINQIQSLTSANPSDASGVFHFENQYNINPKGYHLTGLLLIPLPFVGMDLFLGGNHCQYISFLIDTKTGKLNYFENSTYRDPLTKPFIENKIQTSFNHI